MPNCQRFEPWRTTAWTLRARAGCLFHAVLLTGRKPWEKQHMQTNADVQIHGGPHVHDEEPADRLSASACQARVRHDDREIRQNGDSRRRRDLPECRRPVYTFSGILWTLGGVSLHLVTSCRIVHGHDPASALSIVLIPGHALPNCTTCLPGVSHDRHPTHPQRRDGCCPYERPFLRLALNRRQSCQRDSLIAPLRVVGLGAL